MSQRIVRLLTKVNLRSWRLRLQKVWEKVSFTVIALIMAAAPLLPFMGQRAGAVADMTAPVLETALITDGQTIDTVNTMYPGYNSVFIDFHVTDNMSGNIAPIIIYTSPSGRQTATGSMNVMSPNAEDWAANISFPQYSESGVWVPQITLEDNSLNRSIYNDSQIHALGIDIDVTVTGNGDTTDPALSTVTRTDPGTLDVTSFSPSATFDVTMTDNLSGLGMPTMVYTSPTGAQTSTVATCEQQSGWTQEQSIYSCHAYFAQHAENGLWTPDMIITDGAGNTVHYTNSYLQAHGIDARVNVVGTSDTTPPTLSDVALTFANPPADNIPYGGAVLTLTGNISDDLTGINAGSYIAYTSPSGKVINGLFDFVSPTPTTFTSNVYLPSFSEGGTWQPSVYLVDVAGNHVSYNTTDLANLNSNLAVTVTKNITETASAGGTVTSDYENDGATATSPIEASVTTPTGGPVSIVIIQSTGIDDPTNGYTFFDRQISINAPVESVSTPLTLTFLVDSSKIPVGESASSLQITRNGTVVPTCTDQTTASPNPCIFSRTDLAGGDIEVKVHTTTASAWASGFPSRSPYNFLGFQGSVKNYPKVNKVQAGQVVEVKFKVEGVPQGVTDILDAGQPTSQQVNCTTLATIGEPQAALSSDNEGLERQGKKFTYEWRTKKNWNNTCRIFILKLNDNTTQKALFKF